MREACEATRETRWLESSDIGQAPSGVKIGQAPSGVKVRQTRGGKEVLAWKPWKVLNCQTQLILQMLTDKRQTWKLWKVEAWNSRQLASAGQQAGQDDALTNLGTGFCCLN